MEIYKPCQTLNNFDSLNSIKYIKRASIIIIIKYDNNYLDGLYSKQKKIIKKLLQILYMIVFV